MNKKIQSALISVFHKEGLKEIIEELHKNNVSIYSTGGTAAYIESLKVPVLHVEDLTGYPSILGGRVKTLHPKIFGGILGRRELESDQKEMKQFEIPELDLVIVDLYPFEATVASGASEADIIEKIDIGGISLIRAAAKNFKDVCIVASQEKYKDFLSAYKNGKGALSIDERKSLAASAFKVSSHYDTSIHAYFTGMEKGLDLHFSDSKVLRYGENPHQKGVFYGPLNDMFEQISGKELSYNNLVDADSAVHYISEFEEPTFVIIKHNNACGVATRDTVLQAWKDALACDPVSSFGGILVCNKTIDFATAQEIDKLFYEVLIAPDFDAKALELLSKKPKRTLVKLKNKQLPSWQFKTCLNGMIGQERDAHLTSIKDFTCVTEKSVSKSELNDLHFANKIVKHTKSNTIVLAKDGQLLASGMGQTSRVDALEQAIHKAKNFGFDLKGSVMASDAFFPFPDCVEIAAKAGITAVLQPGGSIKDQESIDMANGKGISMVVTGNRHFKH